MKNRWQSDCGQGLVEMAMVLLLFLLLIFAISDFSILFYVYQSMEHGISEATRYGITGQQMPDPNDPSSFLSREESIKLVMCKSNPIIDLDDSSFTFEHLSEAVWIAGYGGPGDISRVTVKYNWSPVTPLIKSLFKDGQIPLQASSTVKNESFPTP